MTRLPRKRRGLFAAYNDLTRPGIPVALFLWAAAALEAGRCVL